MGRDGDAWGCLAVLGFAVWFVVMVVLIWALIEFVLWMRAF